MKFIIFFLTLFFVNSVYAQSSFVYDEHGKRDPFMPLVSSDGIVITYDEDLSVTDLALEGIVADDSGNNVAIVNGKMIKVNDRIGPYVVMAIDFDQVEFLKGSDKFILRMKKGTN